MTQEQLQKILIKIAKNNHTTPEDVRREMEYAMEIGQQNPDPASQAKWNAIPRKSEQLTLEEFLDYMISTVRDII